MSAALATILLLNLGLIGALPRIFFRPGRFTRGWWLTAAPFFVSAAALIAGALGSLQPWITHDATEVAAALLATLSITVIWTTLGTHQRPLALWHQPDDRPTHLVTHGPYGWIRHPFYAAFQLTLFASVLAFPHVLTVGSLVYGMLRLDATAALEERTLARSEVGAAYRAYMSGTRRFWPLPRRGLRS